MSSGIFSKYEGAENRVTAAFTATLRTLSVQSFEFVLQRLSEEMVGEVFLSIYDQRSRGGKGVPDAQISASFLIIVETKLSEGAFEEDQLEAHTDRLVPVEDSPYKYRILLTISPEETRSRALTSISEKYPESGIVFSHLSFLRLTAIFEELFEERGPYMSEVESYIINEFLNQLSEQGLVGTSDQERLEKTMVVAGGHAWPFYMQVSDEKHVGAYICQPNRPYRGSGYLAFYYSKKIMPVVPRIRAVFPEVDFSLPDDESPNSLIAALEEQIVFGPGYSDSSDKETLVLEAKSAINHDVEQGNSNRGDVRMIFLLTLPKDSDNLSGLPVEGILNDSKNKNGDLAPYTMGVWRNVETSSLSEAKLTSQITKV